MEVCLDGSLHSVPPITRRELEDLEQLSSANIHPCTFDSEEIPQQDLSVPENVDSTTIPANVLLDAERQPPGIESNELEPAAIADQHSQAADSASHIQTEDLPANEAIDPAILNDCDPLDAEQIQLAESITGIATNEYPLNYSQFLNKEPPFRQASKVNNTAATTAYSDSSLSRLAE